MPTLWEANFIPGIFRFDEREYYLVKGGRNVKFRFPHARSLRAEYPIGMYKTCTSTARGYTLMWPPNDLDNKIRIDYEPQTLFVRSRPRTKTSNAR